MSARRLPKAFLNAGFSAMRLRSRVDHAVADRLVLGPARDQAPLGRQQLAQRTIGARLLGCTTDQDRRELGRRHVVVGLELDERVDQIDLERLVERCRGLGCRVAAAHTFKPATRALTATQVERPASIVAMPSAEPGRRSTHRRACELVSQHLLEHHRQQSDRSRHRRALDRCQRSKPARRQLRDGLVSREDHAHRLGDLKCSQ